jgi:hypothetical protein
MAVHDSKKTHYINKDEGDWLELEHQKEGSNWWH